MTDTNSTAAKTFYRMVRDFSLKTKPWDNAIFYETKPDEIWDVTLASRRIYGRADEFLAVMAAAGLDAPDRPLKQQRLVLPTEGQLYSIKRSAGFESLSDYRKSGKPTWGGS